MNAKPLGVVGDLANWELPSLAGRMNKLIDLLQKKKLSISLNPDSLGEQVYSQLWDHVRELGATAANEVITGWMQGLADGRPELCVSFPYLESDPDATPLSIGYSVSGHDGSRMELRQVDLEETLLEHVSLDKYEETELEQRSRRARVTAEHLRKLADRVDGELRPVRHTPCA